MLQHSLENFRIKSLYKQGRWSQSLVARSHTQLENHPSNNTLRNYIEVRHSLCGFGKSSLDELLYIASSIKSLSQNLRFRLQALCLEYDMALRDDIGHIVETPRLQRYPSLAANLHRNAQAQSDLTTLAKQFIERTLPLTDSLDAFGPLNRICIVGNAPSELGKERQSDIDGGDLVFRFNHANTDKEFQQAYGTRTDYWVISPSYALRPTNLKAQRIVVSGISPFDKPSQYWKVLARLDNIAYYTFPKTIWYSLVTKLAAPPSAGILCLATLTNWRSEETIIESFGFSSGAVTRQNHYADNQKRSNRHNWVAESELLGQLVAQCAPN